MPDSVSLEFISEQLKRIQTGQTRLLEDMGDLKKRMTGVEEALAGQSRRLDRVEDRLDRIERRLDLVDAPAE